MRIPPMVKTMGFLRKKMSDIMEGFDNLQEALNYHNESGLVMYQEGNTIICNWSNVDGLPAGSIFGILGSNETIYVANRQIIQSWREFLQDNNCNVIYDANNDVELADDCEAEMIELENGVIVVAPLDWN